MKKTIILALLLTLLTTAKAQQKYADYYTNLPKPMAQAQEPNIPDYAISLKDYGGKGDGLTLNTEAFRQAIAHLTAKGGGHLNVPDGIYLTAAITLGSHIDLHLSKNAIIVMTSEKKDMIRKDGKRSAPGISAEDCTDISVTGEGIIDGNGEWWRPVKRSKMSDVEWKTYLSKGGTVSKDGTMWYPAPLKHFAQITESPEKEANIREDVVRFTDCQRVLLKGVTVLNSPRFHVHPVTCTDVIIDGINVRCDWNVQNGDGIDLSSCKRCLVVNNTLNVGDDGICMKSGSGEKGLKDGPCEDILIQGNTVFHAHGGFVIGSDVSGGMKNIVVRDNRFCMTDIGLRFKSNIDRGGKIEDIYISHIYMTDIANAAIFFETTYENNKLKDGAEEQTKFSPNFQDIHISDIVCRGCKTGIYAKGGDGMIHDIDVERANIFYTDKATDIGSNCGIRLKDVVLKTFDM